MCCQVVILLLLSWGNVDGAPANTTNVSTPAATNCTGDDRLNFNCINRDLEKVQSSLLQLFLVTAVSGIWLLYLTFFHSRLIGLVVTKIVNQFYKGNLKDIRIYTNYARKYLSWKLIKKSKVYRYKTCICTVAIQIC